MGRRKNDIIKPYYNKARNNWFVTFPIIDSQTNIEKKYKKYFKTKEEANEEIKQFEYKKINKVYIENNGIPIYKLMEYINERKLKNGKVQIGQYGKNNDLIKKIVKNGIGKKEIAEITSEDLEDYFNTLKNYRKSYMEKIISQFSQSFKYAEKHKLIQLNPMYDVIIPKSTKESKEIRALEVKEQKKLTDYLLSKSIIEEPYKNVFLIQMYMGLRIGEVCALMPEDIDWEENVIHIRRTIKVDDKGRAYVGKTTKTPAGVRDVPIPKNIKMCVKEQVDNYIPNKYNLIFLNTIGNILTHQKANDVLKRIVLHTLKVDDITTHSLRHTFGTRCIEAGISPVVVQRLMGHESIEITINRYVSVLRKFQNDELEKLSKFYNKNNMFKNVNLNINLNINLNKLEFER